MHSTLLITSILLVWSPPSGAHALTGTVTRLFDTYSVGGGSAHRVSRPTMHKAGQEYREALYLPRDASISSEIDIPASASLDFGYLPSGDLSGDPTTTLEVTIRKVGAHPPNVIRYTYPAKKMDATWRDETIRLSQFAGERAEIVFSVSGRTGAEGGVVVSNPVVWHTPSGKGIKRVVLISLDALRADRLEPNGSMTPPSPELSRIVKRGTLFSNAFTAAVWTGPSHASMFTSLYPSRHRFENSIDDLDKLSIRLKDNCPTLARILRGHGFSTHAIGEGGIFLPVSGLLGGFDSFLNTPSKARTEYPAPSYPTGIAATFGEAIRWLEKNRDKPFLLFLHTYETHLVYSDTPFSLSRQKDYPGRVKFGRQDEFEEVALEAQYRGYVPDFELSNIRNRYDGLVVNVSSWLEKLLCSIENLGIGEETLVIITSDHGDQLLDRGPCIDHGNSLCRELTRVPLVMISPGNVPEVKKIPQAVSLIDLLPTILDLLGLHPPERLQGVSVVPLLRGEKMTPRNLFSECAFNGRKVSVLDRESRYRYIFTTIGYGRELYDIREDPLEEQNIVKKYPHIAESLQREIENYLRDNDRGYYLVIHPGDKGIPYGKITVSPLGGTTINAWNIGQKWGEKHAGRRPIPYTWNLAGLDITPGGLDREDGFYFVIEPDNTRFRIEFEGGSRSNALPLFVGGSEARTMSRSVEINPAECVYHTTPQFSQPGIYLFRYSLPGASAPLIEVFSKEESSGPIGQQTKEMRDQLRALGYLQ